MTEACQQYKQRSPREAAPFAGDCVTSTTRVHVALARDHNCTVPFPDRAVHIRFLPDELMRRHGWAQRLCTSEAELRPGDLLFWHHGGTGHATHVSMVLRPGAHFHCSLHRDGTRIEPLADLLQFYEPCSVADLEPPSTGTAVSSVAAASAAVIAIPPLGVYTAAALGMGLTRVAPGTLCRIVDGSRQDFGAWLDRDRSLHCAGVKRCACAREKQRQLDALIPPLTLFLIDRVQFAAYGELIPVPLSENLAYLMPRVSSGLLSVVQGAGRLLGRLLISWWWPLHNSATGLSRSRSCPPSAAHAGVVCELCSSVALH